jgi:hypothetical protein
MKIDQPIIKLSHFDDKRLILLAWLTEDRGRIFTFLEIKRINKDKKYDKSKRQGFR